MPASEPITLTRDCTARLVPSGQELLVPAGTEVRITQELGGSFTVHVGGNLMRIDGRDADALGREPPAAPELSEDAGDEDVEKMIWDQMRQCYDPEIPVNIVDLGLVYSCRVEPTDSGGRRVHVDITLTAPGCGMGPVLVEDVRKGIEAVPTVEEAVVDLVFDPPWSPQRMSEAARLQTGLM